MKILVIDDAKWNLFSAKETLKEHDVTVCGTIKEAYDLLGGRDFPPEDLPFDAVLTDLLMPVGDFTGAMNTGDYPAPSGDLPAGLVFALKASNEGIRTVICTDANHHQDWICSLLDLIGYPGEEARVAFVEADTCCIEGIWDEEAGKIVEDEEWYKSKMYIKNWKKAMIESELFPELK